MAQADDGLRPAVKAMEGAPPIGELESYCWEAFIELGTERPIGMGGAGPIPYGSILKYAEFNRLSRADTEFLLYVIQHLDRAQMAIAAKNQAKKSPTK
jgi:hypothetical protein